MVPEVVWDLLEAWVPEASQALTVRRDPLEQRVLKVPKVFRDLRVSQVLRVSRVLLGNKDHPDPRVLLENVAHGETLARWDRRALLVLVDCRGPEVPLVLRVQLDPLV